MIIVHDTRGGVTLRRDDAPDAAPLFVAEDELAALLARLIGEETAEEWDAYAFLSGNPAIAMARQ